jgi:hypothetical protein
VHTELRPSHGVARASVGKLHAPAEGLVKILLEPRSR